MKNGDTELLSRQDNKTDARRHERRGPGRARWALLVALLAVGAIGSYTAISYHEAAPVADGAASAEMAVAQDQRMRDAAGSDHSPVAEQGSGHDARGMDGMDEPAKSNTVTPKTVGRGWGIRIERVALIADGGFVDLRYRVTDPEKASGVMDEDSPIYLLDEESGGSVTTAHLPKLGDLRQNFEEDARPDRIYFMGFGNPEGLFERGDRVTLAVGAGRLEHLTVR